MSIMKEFNEIKRNATYYKDFYRRIYHIFAGKGGSQVITEDILPKNHSIKKLLILNHEMNHALNYVHDELYNLNSNAVNSASFLFYFSQYGGSKTQFLHLVQSEMNNELPNVISVMFEDLTQINVHSIFNKMLGQIFKKVAFIPKFEEEPRSYRQFFEGLNQIIASIQVSLHQSKNLQKAEEIIKSLYNVRNIETKKKLDELNELLHSTILVDSMEILNLILKLMQYCSQHGLVFLFLFDEVDLWIDERSPELKFSKNFLTKIKFMKSLFQIADEDVKIFYLFACTDRVNELFNRDHGTFGVQSPTASRLVRIFDASEIILEPGTYGEAMKNALVKLAAYHAINFEDNNVDLTLLQESLPILQKKYKSLSRRNCNSKILQLLKNYNILYNSLQVGMKEWQKYTQRYGQLIEDNLESIMKRLNIKFIRKQVPIEPSHDYTRDKIDGYFVNYDLHSNEIKTYVEIKLTKNFKRDKAYQVLQWVQLHPNKPIVMIIFSNTPMKTIKEEIIAYAEKEGYELEDVEKIRFIHIKNPYAFCAINGIDAVSDDPSSFSKFIEAFAMWLDFFGDFTKQYQDLKEALGLNVFIPPAPLPAAILTSQEHGTDAISDSAGARMLETSNTVTSQATAPQSTIRLSSDARTCVTLLNHMYQAKSFTNSGRMTKSKISALISSKSMGISDLENLLEVMKKSNIVLSISPKMVTFDPEYRNIQSIDEFNKKILEKLGNSHTNQGIKGFL